MRLTHVSAAAFAVISIGLTCVPSMAAPPGDLRGSWRVTVTPKPISLCNGPVIAPPPAPFLELASYAGGGVMTETNTQLNFISAAVSPGLPLNGSDGHGTWKAADDGFEVKFTKLLFDSTGHYTGEADLAEELDVSGDTFTGTFTIQINFLNNSPSLCSGGTLSARGWLQSEPLSAMSSERGARSQLPDIAAHTLRMARE